MPTLATTKTCTGCSACANACGKQAITMTPDHEGFWLPQIDSEKCVECGLCEKSCPVVSPRKQTNYAEPKAYALWHNEDRQKSSSGGAFSAIARKMLSEGGIVYGAAFAGFDVHHIKAETLEELAPIRESKYVQSEIGLIYKDIRNQLLTGRKVLFTGTPCQVAGLQSYLRKNYDNLIVVDLACHGVPSVPVLKSYIRKLQNRLATGEISGFRFRNLHGWGIAPAVKIGAKFRRVYCVDSLYMSAFDKAALFRHSCYQCPYANIPRTGDCTIADFWGIGYYGDKFRHNTMKGVSLVLVNNEKGKKILKSLNDCFIEERNIKESLHLNHNLLAPSKLHPQRDGIIAAFLDEDKSLDDINNQFHLAGNSLNAKVYVFLAKAGIYPILKRMYNLYKMI